MWEGYQNQPNGYYSLYNKYKRLFQYCFENDSTIVLIQDYNVHSKNKG